MKNINFPKLNKDQFALVQIEASTGIALNTVGKYLLKGSEDEKFLIFEVFEDALSFIEKQNKTNIEYFVLDHKEEVIHQKVVHKEDTRINLQKKPWWKFWIL